MKKFILFTLLVCFYSTVSAQDTVYFTKNNSYGNTAKKNKHSAELNIIKISPLSFLSGFVPVYYERELNSFLSIQVGAGITTRNYVKGWFNNVGDEDNFNQGETQWAAPGNEGNSNQLDPYNYTNRKPVIGFCFSVQPRIYFESEGMDGSFIGISYDYYHYANNQKLIVPGPGNGNGSPMFSSSTFKEYEKFSDISAYFGTQTLYDRIALEYSLGVGLRNIKAQQYAYTTDFATGDYIDGIMNTKKTKLAFNLAIKVGYHF